MGRLAEMLKEFCEDHPIGMIIAVAILIVVLVLSGALTSCSALGSGINSGTVATSFTAEDDDIRQVEADYVALETVLQNKVAMEESSNYKCSESHQSGGFFAVTKERRALMYAKLDKEHQGKGMERYSGMDHWKQRREHRF